MQQFVPLCSTHFFLLLCFHKIIYIEKMYARRKWQGALLTRKKVIVFRKWFNEKQSMVRQYNSSYNVLEWKKHFFCREEKNVERLPLFMLWQGKKIVFSYKNIFLFPLIVFGLSSLKCLWKKLIVEIYSLLLKDLAQFLEVGSGSIN